MAFERLVTTFSMCSAVTLPVRRSTSGNTGLAPCEISSAHRAEVGYGADYHLVAGPQSEGRDHTVNG